MPYFDFHIHPTLKSLFSDPPDKLSPWNSIEKKYIPFLVEHCSDMPYILCNQSNLEQLFDGACRLICFAIHAPERYFLDNDLIRPQLDKKKKLGKYLHKDVVNNIINNKDPYSISVTRDMVNTFLSATNGNKKIKAITKATDYNENDGDTLHAVFTIEGLHSLSYGVLHCDDAPVNVQEIKDNLSKITDELGIAVLAVNVNHIQQSKLCNMAYAIQFLSQDDFSPKGDGIQPEGVELISHCYSKKIMIDIKHMSLGARKQLYNLRNTNTFNGDEQPVICTHAGFTGISWNNIPDYVFNAGKAKNGSRELFMGKAVVYGDRGRPAFNTSSINLYDEDIVEILKSKGMIGLSLDKRILGFQDYFDGVEGTSGENIYPFEKDVISELEFEHFITKPHIGQAFDDEKVLTWSESQLGEGIDPDSAIGRVNDTMFYHLKHFMAHVLHFMAIIKNNNLDWDDCMKRICIGSDFDGLVNNVWCCMNATEFSKFKHFFESRFMAFAQEASGQVQLPAGFDVAAFANKLFYENGRDYVLARLA